MQHKLLRLLSEIELCNPICMCMRIAQMLMLNVEHHGELHLVHSSSQWFTYYKQYRMCSLFMVSFPRFSFNDLTHYFPVAASDTYPSIFQKHVCFSAPTRFQ